MFTLFKLVAFVNRYGLVRHHFLYPPGITSPWGHLIGLILGTNQTIRSQIKASMEAFFPKKSQKSIRQLTKSSLAYFGISFLNLIFNLPLTGYKPYMKYFSFDNIHLLDEAYVEAQRQGTGVILVVSHTADFVHYLPGFGQHPHGYKTLVIGNMSNSPIYQYLIARPGFKNMVFFPSIKYSRIAPLLEKRLLEGRMLILYSDYSQPNQLRVPMWEGEYPYLIHSLQSGIRLHRKTKAIIVPCFAYPDGGMGKVRMKIVDNTEIMDCSRRYWQSSEKEFHGRMSLVINKVMYKHIRPIVHCWEEIMNFAHIRIADSIHFPANTTVSQLVELVHEKMNAILTNSWEPDRNDDLFFKEINQVMQQIPSKVLNSHKIILSAPSYIDLSRMDSCSEIRKICLIVGFRMKLAGERDVAEIFDDLRSKFI